MDPNNVLRPNYLGEEYNNRGISELVKNRGIGVREALAKSSLGLAQNEDAMTPEKSLNKLRVAKAREFGKKKTQVGF